MSRGAPTNPILVLKPSTSHVLRTSWGSPTTLDLLGAPVPAGLATWLAWLGWLGWLESSTWSPTHGVLAWSPSIPLSPSYTHKSFSN